MQIEVSSLTKTFKVNKKAEGLKGAIVGLFSREYRIAEAVKKVSFSIEQGECVGFIGPNGAGKTTTIKMLTGLIYPDAGDVNILGYIPWKRSNEYKKQISLVMGNKFQLWWDLPAIESFNLNRKIYSIPPIEYRETLEELCTLLNVTDLIYVPVRNLSLGERMKMEIIAALLHRPKIMFLDEPTIGLDFESQRAVRKFLRDYNAKYNTTIIMTSHYMEDIEAVCDRLIMISKGSIIYDGEKEKLADEYQDNVNINVKVTGEIDIQKLKELCISVQSDNNEYFIKASKTRYLELTQYLLATGKVKDLGISDIPLESVVESCYKQNGGESSDGGKIHRHSKNAASRESNIQI